MTRTARKETEYENMMETVKTAEIAREFKAGGGKVEGKTRAAVATALGISSAQAGKYQAIYKHLTPTLMRRYKDGVIGTQVAYELSSLPKRQQEEVAALYPVPTMENARALKSARKQREKAPCQTAPTEVAVATTDAPVAQSALACSVETPPPPAEQPTPPIQPKPKEPSAVAVSPAPVSELPATEPPTQDTDTDTDALADAARDLSNYCEAHGSGECCQGCYFYDDVRGACRIGLPFTWEV